MGRKIGIGCQDFEKIRVNGNFYVDKTLFIKEWWGANDEVTLISRPRRFGKTLNMSMLEKFFSVEYRGRGDLFEGLSIWEDTEYRRLQGTYPVIFLSFADVKETSFQEARKKICYNIESLYDRYDLLLEKNILNEKEKKFYQSVSADMEDYVATSSLKTLSGYLSRYHEKKAIILLDEYDTPMQEAYIHGYWDQMLSFIRSLFNSAFKTNPYLERALMTGITRISRESVFSDLNNLKVVTTTSEKYEDSFGFTEKEVFAALDGSGLSDRRDDVKRWYDGFTFGRLTDIYNPWSILNYLDTERFDTYWANSSSNSLVSKLLREGNKSIKQGFEILMKEGILQIELDEQIVYDQLAIKKNAVWSLLLASGYLKVENVIFDPEKGRYVYSLTLTNREVRMMFEDMVQGWFEEGGNEDHNDLIEALMAGDVDAMNGYMNSMSLSLFSYFDTGKHPSRTEPERFYHGFVLGLLVDLKGRYVLTSNRESGLGRYDIMLEPLRMEDDAIIIEFKVFRPGREKDLLDTAEAALAQIEEREYETILTDKGIGKERIRKYGFAFRGKKVLIMESSEETGI